MNKPHVAGRFDGKKLLFLLAGLLTLAGGLFAQDDDPVVNEAREKYRKAKEAQEQQEKNGNDESELSIDVTIRAEARSKNSPDENQDTEEPLRKKAFSFQYLPGLPASHRDVAASVALGLITSSVGGIDGFQLAPIGVMTTGRGSDQGIQAAGVFAMSSGNFGGLQAASIFSMARGDLDGLQSSGIFNKAGNVNGAQAAGILNIAGDVDGFQAAGIINVAGDVDGVQAAGIINVAKDVRGLQIGLINVADKMDGLSIGLISFNNSSTNEISAFMEDDGSLYGGINIGGKHLFLSAFAGGKEDLLYEVDSDLVWGTSLAVRGIVGPLYLQGEAGVRSVFALAKHPGTEEERQRYGDSPFVREAWYFPSARLSLGLTLWGPISLFGGVTVNFDSDTYWDVPASQQSALQTRIFQSDFTAHFKWFFGLTI